MCIIKCEEYKEMSVKFDVLGLLCQNRGKTVSGEYIADKLGVSRAAVWKAINGLKEEGYSIASERNKGYVFSLNDDKLIGEAIGLLAPDFMPFVYDEVDSTNDEAKRLAIEYPNKNIIVVANAQRNGRGRRGRSFYSPCDTGVYFSVVIHPDIPPEKSVLVTTAAALATAETIESITGKTALIKWINDVYVDGKKCVGILTEATLNCESAKFDNIIVGIGVNVTTSDFPADISDRAGSIGAASRNELVAKISEKLLRYTQPLTGEFMREYEKRCFVIGKIVTVLEKNGREYEAKATGLTALGELTAETANGRSIVLNNEEVSVKVR